MIEITKKNLVLTFSTAAGATVNLTINAPSESLDAQQIGSAMQAIIDSNALGEDQLVTKAEEAKYVIQEVEKINL